MVRMWHVDRAIFAKKSLKIFSLQQHNTLTRQKVLEDFFIATAKKSLKIFSCRRGGRGRSLVPCWTRSSPWDVLRATGCRAAEMECSGRCFHGQATAAPWWGSAAASKERTWRCVYARAPFVSFQFRSRPPDFLPYYFSSALICNPFSVRHCSPL
jgi:hypothetical protein